MQDKEKNTKPLRKKRIVKRCVDKESFDIILSLFKLALETVKTEKKLADRYVDIARKIAMAKQIRIPSELRRQFCTHCYSYLLPGYNCKIRSKNGCIIYHCPYCKRMGKYRIRD